MRNHLEAHRLRQYQGDIPAAWLESQRLVNCGHCNRLVVGQEGTMHPTCRAEARPSGTRGQAVGHPTESSHSSAIDVTRILLANRPTLRYVPKGCRSLWTTVLTRALSAVVLASSPSSRASPQERDLAWAELICLAKAVLIPAPRSGKKHKRAQENYTRCLLQRWLDGDKDSLWASACRSTSKRTAPRNSDAARIARAIDLVEEGKDSQACKTLVSTGLAPDSADTRSALQAKHPAGTPVPPELASAPASLERFADKDVLAALRAFAKGSSPGPSGLRAQHLLDAVSGPHQAAALQMLTDVANLLAEGRAPQELAQHLAGASLVALTKDDADVRPIAVGEVLRRLTSKCLCAAVKEGAREIFEPVQVGVGCPLGLEAAVHTVAQYRQRHAASRRKLILTIDFKNAFNTVSRSAFLRACREHLPSVSAWASWCYSSPSRLLFSGHVISSSAGVQQGDNLGPLLFSLALHPTLLRMKAVAGVDLVIGYLDDVVIAGDDAAVLETLGILRHALGDLDLGLNLRKCELIPTAGADSEVELATFPADMKRVADSSFKFLGTPIGPREYVTAFTQHKRVDKASALLRAVTLVEDGQVSHKLLMRCMGSCRVMHAMRTTRPDWIHEQMRQVDAAIVEALEVCMGLALPRQARTQVTLPAALGGLGLRSAELHAASAYISSRTATRRLRCAMDPSFVWEIDDPGNGLAAAIGFCNAVLTDSSALHASDLENTQGVSQKELSRRLDTAVREALLESADPASRARIRATGAAHAGSWLAALPSEGLDQRFKHPEFVAALRLWLGLPFLSNDCWCPRCDQVLDRLCTHAMACMSGGDAVRLHNALRDFVYVKSLAAGLAPERERSGLLPDDPRRRPGDIFFELWPGGQGIAMDFAVTSPLQLDALRAASQSELAAATAYEATKFADRDTGQRCRDHGVRLVPMVAESFGGWGPEAQRAFKVLGRAISSSTGTPHGTVVAQLYQSLSVKIMRASARSSLARAADAAVSSFCPAVARAEGEFEAR